MLAVDPDAKKVTLTLKKSLLGSKLPPLADVRQAAPGAKAHGTVTGESLLAAVSALCLPAFPPSLGFCVAAMDAAACACAS